MVYVFVVVLHAFEIRTIIPARGRNTGRMILYAHEKVRDKNHNPRKGTELYSSADSAEHTAIEIRTIIPARGRNFPAPFSSGHF